MSLLHMMRTATCIRRCISAHFNKDSEVVVVVVSVGSQKEVLNKPPLSISAMYQYRGAGVQPRDSLRVKGG